MAVGTITRAALVAATEATIRTTEDEIMGYPVSDTLREKVLDVAATAELITAAWWIEAPACGCLIGTIYGSDIYDIADGLDGKKLSYQERKLALEFPEQLFKFVTTEAISPDHYYRVID